MFIRVTECKTFSVDLTDYFIIGKQEPLPDTCIVEICLTNNCNICNFVVLSLGVPFFCTSFTLILLEPKLLV